MYRDWELRLKRGAGENVADHIVLMCCLLPGDWWCVDTCPDDMIGHVQ